ncbi:MAG: copper-binding protein [Gammaproteobacteria bacterium]|nr:copper-binding protein [Gammaproteobacteria bacterium]MBU1602013.1 copper-binding protein [Gammaproteobacteria bacterium]MBU2433990.1 copper-binding protein [Gammaproteobacteria bacterium]MBU2447814.1 copper-binding protein [Gammaproteobacteria bacterium]
MKHTVTLTLLIALALGTGTALAADKMGDMKDMDMGKQKMDDMKGMEMGGQKAMPGAPHQAVGVVKEIDPKAGKVTFAHEPVKSLNWPAMTMGFAVKDKTLLDKLAVGKKVNFEFVKEGKGYTVTSVK